MICASGARGPGFKSRTSPIFPTEHPEKDIIDDEIDAAATSHVDRFEDIASKVKPLDRKRLRARKKDGYVSSDDYSSDEDYSDEGNDFLIKFYIESFTKFLSKRNS